MARLYGTPFPGFGRFDARDIEGSLAREQERLEEIRRKYFVVSFPVADGAAMYAVVKEKPLTLRHIPYGDAYKAMPATIRGLTMAEVERQRKYDSFMQGMQDEAEAFYVSLKEGQIVHYHHGFGEFVRCKAVVRDGRTELLPVALVGAWGKHELPKRMRDGSIREGHYPKMISEGETLRPHATSILENPKFAHRGAFPDPTGLPPIDLSVPEMGEDEAERARLWRVVARVREAVSNVSNERDPAEVLELVRRIAAA